MSFAERNPRLVYFIFLIAMAAMFFIFYSRYRMHLATLKEGERVTVQVDEVVCAGFKDSRNYIVFSRNNDNHIVNVGRAHCSDYRKGDTTTVLYNKANGLYFPLHLTTNNDWWGMVGGGLGVLVAVYFFIFRRKSQ